MGKRFKLKISKVFLSFRSYCSKSKGLSKLPSNHDPSFFRLSSVNPKPITLHLPQPHCCSSLRRHVSSAFSCCGLGTRSLSSAQYFPETDCSQSPRPPTPEFHWEEEDRWHVIAKGYDDNEITPRRKIYNISRNEDEVDVFLPPPPPPNTEKKKRRYKNKKTTVRKFRINSSSADSSGILFSSESITFDDDDINEEETESLVSSPSRNFSTGITPEFNANSEKHKKKKKKQRVKKEKRYVVKDHQRNATMRLSSSSSSKERESPARLSSFLRRTIPCTVGGKVRESFAVVKKSEDPYEDFKRSMLEMILQKQMFEDKDLEQLLHCFLSLNSRHHHGIIVQAFVEIWEALFSRRSTSFPISSALIKSN